MSVLDVLYIGFIPTVLLTGMLWKRVYLRSMSEQLSVIGFGMVIFIVALALIGFINWGDENAFWSAVLFRAWSVGQFMMLSGGILIVYGIVCFMAERVRTRGYSKSTIQDN